MGLPAAISIAHTRTLFPRGSVSHLLALIGRGEAARPRRSHFPMKPARNEKRQSCFASPLPRFKGGQIESACYHHRRLMSTTAEEFGSRESKLKGYLENASAIRTPPSGLFHYIDNEEIDKYLKPLYRSYWSIISAENRPHLAKRFTFKNYKATMEFMNEVAKLAQQEKHHPKITFEYDYAEIHIQTHAIAPSRTATPKERRASSLDPGVSLADVRLAALIESFFVGTLLADGRGKFTGETAGYFLENTEAMHGNI